MKKLFPLILILFVFTACSKKKAKNDEEIIQDYIEANNLNAEATGTGLYYVRSVTGTGDGCDENSTVRVAYKGYLTDGKVFDESSEEGISFGLWQVIQGWTEGIPYFKEGGEGILLIPSELGYGNQAVGSIPANSVLIFDIKLIEVL
ncbi:FKBP-type peptidyl-prolyl cis-trans isomerase [Crocinitomix catalasitica]|uniref:FKBP-type peptidyl-prolyl cis-trans isomerase n=1 Tax=Crocinitomix catalasitica TaxID=184607 RepID=UPI000480F75B|nr:FKBP-type peptidyl-prolyl cis-trans isomerase [Crocinitomix catalasitica]